MRHDDNSLGKVLWLAAGGAAGYTAARLIRSNRADVVVAPTRAAHPRAVSAPAAAAPPRAPSPRVPAAGRSGSMRPIEPYATQTTSPNVSVTGPSGSMQPIDPYAPSITVPVITTTTVTSDTSAPTGSATPGSDPPPIDGPITRPSQLAASSASAPMPITLPEHVETPHDPAPKAATAPSHAFATSARVRRFDPLFESYRGAIPIEYVRALVERESDGQPSVRAGSAIGLMQIVPVVLTDYNKRHGTSFQHEQLVDPAINISIGCELLRIIIASYRKYHPRIVTLHANWNSRPFVELLTFGWNAGFSEAGGVGRVARYLEGLGATDITIDQVSDHAKLAGASKHLSNPAKVRWCKGVAALYLRERARTHAAKALTSATH